MDERWQQMWRIFHDAAGLAPVEREALLRETCADDASLRSEVESLLLHDGNPEALQTQSGQRMHLIGQRIGIYEIRSLLGVGGMGEVYRARDSKLDRDVAIKVLPSELASDAERLSRFQREARILASLNHPHIGAIYELEEIGGAPVLVLELVEGETLADRIARGPLSLDDSLRIASSIAVGLEAAHAKGIVHRDVKPANIKLTAEGVVKVLDFGLAKGDNGSGDRTQSPTLTAGGTAEGVLLGTAAYMSPEQARGKPVDRRTDIWSFGCVVYEMLSSRRPFSGETTTDVLAAIVERDPDWTALPRKTPPAVRRLLERCLQKDLANRLQDIADAKVQIDEALTVNHRRAIPVIGVVTLVAVIAAAAGVWLWVDRGRVHRARTVLLPEAVRLIGTGQNQPALRLLEQAEAYIPDDPILRDLLAESTTAVSIDAEPSGALVEIRDFQDPPDRWEPLGEAPIKNRRLAAGVLVWRVSAPGFQPIEVLRPTQGAFPGPRGSTLGFSLDPLTTAHRGMVHVPAGTLIAFGGPVELGDFWIDRHEVTNQQFKSFIDAGGYAAPDHWLGQDAARVFLDSTGRPGPSTWELGGYPDGQDEFPVGGISWYEANAYCRSVGKELPTIHHWYRAATLEATTQLARFGNFAAAGPDRVVGHPLRLGMHGTYDMAGNVKEWVWNKGREGLRHLLGGGWNEPSYMFRDHDAQSAASRAATYGVRCAKYSTAVPAGLLEPAHPVQRDYRIERPVPQQTVNIYRESVYAYARSDLSATIDGVDETANHWRTERISYAAAYNNERVPALLFLPKHRRGPHQIVVFFPGANAFNGLAPISEAHQREQQWIGFIVRSGRAVFLPGYKGSYERFLGPMSGAWRDIVVPASKDLRRGIDYVETRHDLDARKLAFFGVSMGAGAGPIMTALEPRFRASILLGGGLYPWKWPSEADPLNFLSSVTAPTLMINGRHDYFFPIDLSQQPMFKQLGTAETAKRHVVMESGHVPGERTQYIREILDWLVRYLGPVSG